MKRLLKGGRVVDPANGIDGVRDVLIDGDRIARIGINLPVDGAAVVEIPDGLVICDVSPEVSAMSDQSIPISSTVSARNAHTLARDSNAETTSKDGFSVVAPIKIMSPRST